MQMQLQGLIKSFGDKHVLQGVDFTFEQGKIYGLLGRNGAGKTTLFNCISGELDADGGEVFLCVDGSREKLQPTDIGYVLTQPVLPDFLTGREFLKFYMDINRERIHSNRPLDDYFDQIQLDPGDRDRLIKGYSHGMKNKLQMLCFMISKPPVILLDEPLTSLDVVVQLEMKKMLRGMRQDHILIFSTHILQLAVDLCDEIVVLNHGVLQQIDHSDIGLPGFEEEIIDLLREENAP